MPELFGIWSQDRAKFFVICEKIMYRIKNIVDYFKIDTDDKKWNGRRLNHLKIEENVSNPHKN